MHYVFLQHGLWGSPTDFLVIRDKLAETAMDKGYRTQIANYPSPSSDALLADDELRVYDKDVEYVFIVSDVNLGKTGDGIIMGGDRLYDLIKRTCVPGSYLSLIGHSLGGLYARAVLKRLNQDRPCLRGDMLLGDDLTVVNYVSLATPHLGVRETVSYIRGGAHVLCSQTGKDLLLCSDVISSYLADSDSIGALRKCHRRVLYGNAKNDGIVGPCTSLVVDALSPRAFESSKTEQGVVKVDFSAKEAKAAEGAQASLEGTIPESARVSDFNLSSYSTRTDRSKRRLEQCGEMIATLASLVPFNSKVRTAKRPAAMQDSDDEHSTIPSIRHQCSELSEDMPADQEMWERYVVFFPRTSPMEALHIKDAHQKIIGVVKVKGSKKAESLLHHMACEMWRWEPLAAVKGGEEESFSKKLHRVWHRAVACTGATGRVRTHSACVEDLALSENLTLKTFTNDSLPREVSVERRNDDVKIPVG